MTATTLPTAPRGRRFGYAVTILGVLWLSPDALVQRLADTDPFSLIGWRGGLSVLVLAAFLLWRDGSDASARLHRGGWRVGVLGLLYAANSASFVAAIHLAPVADVLVILAATPLCAAILAWFALREVPTRRTALAIALGAAGVLIAAIGGVTGGSPLGMALAVFTTLNLAAQFTMLRRWPQVDNVGAVLIGSILMAALGFAVGDPLSLEGASLLWAVVLGLCLTPIAFTLITIGPRYLTSAEVSLLMLLETAFGPLLVWLALGEQPARSALIGGAVVVLAVIVAASSAYRNPFGRTP